MRICSGRNTNNKIAEQESQRTGVHTTREHALDAIIAIRDSY